MVPLQLSFSAAAQPQPQPQTLPIKVETALFIGPPLGTHRQMQ